MRKIFTLLLLLAGFTVTAQQYNNEWINFNQTYYKFKVGKTGVFRIPKSTLDAVGIGNTQVEFFELWRNGQRVPFYSSVASGTLPGDGYLEFWGLLNDGKPDKAMYRDPAFQHTDYNSLITDTASYFLSINTIQTGFRYVTVTNNVAGNVLPAEPYFMYTTGSYPKIRVNLGFAAVVGEYVYSSSYDKGEFTSSGDITPAAPLSLSSTNFFPYTTGPDATLRFGAVGNALNPRTVKVRVNGTDVKDTLMDYFNDVNTSVTLPATVLSPATVTVQFNNTSLVGTDRMVVSYYEWNYPRLFNFSNQPNFEFSLPARPDGYFLEISNFNTGGVAPVLYDIANGERYIGDIAVAGLVRFALPVSAVERKLVLVNSNASNTSAVTSLTTRLFTRYNLVANQGDYIIVSHPTLHTGSSGNNPVADYKNYRQSAPGGGYTVVIADVEEIIDQFGFGIKKHPVSLRNFLRYAKTNFATPPKFAFLIGKGMTYIDYKKNQQFADAERLNLVPTFGYPGSDNMLSAEIVTNPIASIPIGRLSVINGVEIENYLEKIKEYDLAQKTAANTLADRSWMKNVVHVTGSSDPYLGTVLCHYMNVYRAVIEDTTFGGLVTTFCKSSANPVEQLSSGRLEQLFAEGISFLTYFGHSSSTTLEFNIDNPQKYDNQGKYPVFFVNGCNAGNFFTYNVQRLVVSETLSEKFTLAKQRGSIAFIASTHYGIVNYLNLYLTNLYSSISVTDYGKSIGELQRVALQKMVTATGPYDFYARSHAEEITIHGDPAIRLNTQPKPDYVIEESSIKINPAFIDVAETEFELRVKVTNLGKAVNDSITIEVKQQYPDGSTAVINKTRIKGVRFSDSLTLLVPIVPTRDEGQNKVLVTVDSDLEVDEVTEVNNSATKDFFIYKDQARPIYPYNYAIIKNPVQKLYASTADPFTQSKNYVMEIDTTMNFNSVAKINKTVNTPGGVIEFDPGISYLDSTTYYWRVSVAPQGNDNYNWTNSSFTYMNGTAEGFGQRHFYQHLNSDTSHISLASDGKWNFGYSLNNLFIRNGVYPTAGNQQAAYTSSVNGYDILGPGCAYNEIFFNVIDPITFKPWKNDYSGPTGLYGSNKATCGNNRINNFIYPYNDAAGRKRAMDFLDLVPDGFYVIARTNVSPGPPSYVANVYIDQWMADTTLYGSNNSLYHKLMQLGFTAIDSFITPRAASFVCKKNSTLFAPKYVISKDQYEPINLSADCPSKDTVGYITSPLFGRAMQWHNVRWAGVSLEEPSTDDPTLEVIGVDTFNTEVLLYTLDKYTQNFDLSSVDAALYPYIRLRMRNIDSVELTPFQLRYWHVLYDPAPEGAIASNMYFSIKDSLEVGEKMNVAIAFKNISQHPFDSIAVKVNIFDKNNLQHNVTVPNQRPIATGDTITVRFEIDTKELEGNNILFVDINPDNHQPEQHHFNNFLYRDFYARMDKTNPLLDVTFDGVHILNRDIVSARPRIQIKLKDDAKYLLLNDTALSLVQIKYPDGNIKTYNFDGDTLRFTPASSGEDNTATIDFNPAFLNAGADNEGDEYELIVRGKDRSNNLAGPVEYRVAFRVISKPMISNLLNYPNPFSTSTAFVFTITGSEIPQNIKIQILTVTGKIVREITKDELGPLHIGRNITEFKWNGTDQYGQKLGNGVYLYRVVTTMNGKPMEKYRAPNDDTDKYFTNGYGKMYLMR